MGARERRGDVKEFVYINVLLSLTSYFGSKGILVYLFKTALCLTDVVRSYDSTDISGDIVEWLEKLELVATLQKRDYSMKLVQEHCGKYLEMFAQCMQEYPYTWQADCERERSKLSRCAESNPEIMYIKSVCRRDFELYEECMEDNPQNPERCTLLFEKFSTCAGKALKDMQGSDVGDVKDATKSSERTS